MMLAKHNRIENMSPKHYKHWCFSCDRAQVGEGQKCKICGNVQNRKRLKKDVPFDNTVMVG